MTATSYLAALVLTKRRERGLSQEGLARLIGCSKGAVYNVETGRVKCPRPVIGQGFIDHLGLTPEQVFGVKSSAGKSTGASA